MTLQIKITCTDTETFRDVRIHFVNYHHLLDEPGFSKNLVNYICKQDSFDYLQWTVYYGEFIISIVVNKDITVSLENVKMHAKEFVNDWIGLNVE